MTEDPIHDVHDRGYKFLLSQVSLFRELVEGFVEQPWALELNFEKAVRIEKSFVLESFLEKESDVLYRVPMGDEEVYVYILVEHQSTVDFNMAFRLLTYIVEIWKDFYEQSKQNERRRASFRLPPVFPIVLYNGDAPWTASTCLRRKTHVRE